MVELVKEAQENNGKKQTIIDKIENGMFILSFSWLLPL